jgi:hypothetical protein
MGYPTLVDQLSPEVLTKELPQKEVQELILKKPLCPKLSCRVSLKEVEVVTKGARDLALRRLVKPYPPPVQSIRDQPFLGTQVLGQQTDYLEDLTLEIRDMRRIKRRVRLGC